jgi:hypothetical protein
MIFFARDAGGERNAVGRRLLESVDIGLVGAPGSGLTGLVRSLATESCTPGASLFATKWRIERLASDELIGEPDGTAIEHQRHELLAYLSAESDGAFSASQADFNDPAIRCFAIIPGNGEQKRARIMRQSRSRAKYFKVFDTSVAGDLAGQAEPGWIRHVYRNVPHIILCHPLFPQRHQLEWYKTTLDRLYEGLKTGAGHSNGVRLQTLVVAFTGYELRFVPRPLQAARRAAAASIGRDTLRKALTEYPVLREGLRKLSTVDDLRIVAIPVSTFGFVRNDGRPNCHVPSDRVRAGDIPAPQFLTRPDIYCGLVTAARDPTRRALKLSSSEQIDWLLRHWRPFLTADAFITCVTGESHELIFKLSELLETPRIRQVT